MSWQAAVLVILLLVILYIFRKIQPGFHYYLWCMLLVRLIIPFNIPVPFGLTHSFRTVGETEIKELTQKISFPENNVVMSIKKTLPAITDNSGITLIKSNPMKTAAYIWFGSIIFFLIGSVLWNLHMTRVVKRLVRNERRDIKDFLKIKCRELNISKKIEILCMSEKMPYGPTIVGTLNPKILLPFIVIDSWPIKNIEPLIVHELVHVKRHDQFINLMQIVVQIIFFFNPFVWFANWKIRELREQVCDDLSIKYLENKRRRYTSSFMNVIEIVFENPIWVYANLGFSERKSSLARRIVRITNIKYNPHKPLTVFSNIMLVFTAILTFSLACDYSPEKIMGNMDGNKPERIIGNGDVNAPKVLDEEIKDANGRITIEINEDGEYEVDGIPTKYNDLENALREIIEKGDKDKILIIPDVNTPDKLISNIYVLSLKLGIKKIAKNNIY